MRYRFTLQERDGSWVYVLCFGKDTPTEIEDVVTYSDNCVSAEDAYGVRHYVYSKSGKLVSIHLHDALRLLPYLDPDRLETLRMPGMHAIMFANAPVPTLLLQFRAEPPDTNTAYALSPNVWLIFQGRELALLYVFDVYKVIAEVD
ncbi:MAG TPA: hypothetical protein VGI81_14520 [Tepidisphaeraceae bacterium]|jgi:hypothetical protein